MPDSAETLELPVPNEGGEGADMSTGYQDIDPDVCVHQLESLAETHESLMAESRGNAQVGHNVVRLSGARKFNEVDPIESAAAEVILKKAT